MQRITDRQTIVCLVFLFFSMPTLAEEKDSVKAEVYATYYADRFHGRRTSNGERYDKDAYTCAHRKLPFGTLVKVTNPKNGKNSIGKSERPRSLWKTSKDRPVKGGGKRHRATPYRNT